MWYRKSAKVLVYSILYSVHYVHYVRKQEWSLCTVLSIIYSTVVYSISTAVTFEKNILK